jgi:hypothetical protein
MTKLEMSIKIASALLNANVDENNWKVKDLMKRSKNVLKDHMKLADKINKPEQTIDDTLFSSPCKENGFCRNPDCETAVAQFPVTGRWFITFGHAGYNSKANNLNGYASEESARSAMKHYLNK